MLSDGRPGIDSYPSIPWKMACRINNLGLFEDDTCSEVSEYYWFFARWLTPWIALMKAAALTECRSMITVTWFPLKSPKCIRKRKSQEHTHHSTSQKAQSQHATQLLRQVLSKPQREKESSNHIWQSRHRDGQRSWGKGYWSPRMARLGCLAQPSITRGWYRRSILMPLCRSSWWTSGLIPACWIQQLIVELR